MWLSSIMFLFWRVLCDIVDFLCLKKVIVFIFVTDYNLLYFYLSK